MEWGWGYRKGNMYLVCFKRGYHLQLIKCWLLWTWALRPGWWYPSLLDNQVFAVKHLGKGNMQFGCRSLEVPAKRNKQTNRIKILQGFYEQSLDLAYQPSAFRKLLKYSACHKIGWTYKLPNCKHRITGKYWHFAPKLSMQTVTYMISLIHFEQAVLNKMISRKGSTLRGSLKGSRTQKPIIKDSFKANVVHLR